MRIWILSIICGVLCYAADDPLAKAVLQAVNRQDVAALEKLAAEASATAGARPDDAEAQYRHGLTASFLAQLLTEVDDKKGARAAAETGLAAARRAVSLMPDSAEYRRALGTLCGQMIPGNLLAALKHGKCAADELDIAVKLDPRSPLVWLSRGVGNYYRPAAFGGGIEKSIADLRRAIELDPKLADAHLWLGIALRKANRNGEARQSIEESLRLNPERVWARKQLEKTPAQ